MGLHFPFHLGDLGSFNAEFYTTNLSLVAMVIKKTVEIIRYNRGSHIVAPNLMLMLCKQNPLVYSYSFHSLYLS